MNTSERQSSMKISGFSFSRNAQKLYYPIAESIKSILPVCDEFIIAIGKGDPDDHTREIVSEIGDPKIKIIDTVWTDREKLKGFIHSQQTNIALKECTGDWCFYIQADEIVHEKYLPVIHKRCEELMNDSEIEGLLFKYKHFWGDYDHFLINHAWYPREIRLIKNHLGIKSWETAQSFRKNGRKINVASVDAEIFHYGWVRPPSLMYSKMREFSTTHRGKERTDQILPDEKRLFDYGSLEKLPVYKETYPKVMEQWIAGMDWKSQLQYKGKSQVVHKQDRLKYRILTFLEKICGGRQIGGFKNYNLLKRNLTP
jgi:glycosyltransferase involved in cell wall biosynthesis